MNNHLTATVLVSSFFWLHTLKVLRQLYPRGAFLVYLNLNKATRHPDSEEYPRNFFLKGTFSRYELASHASSHTEKMKPLLARYPPWDPNAGKDLSTASFRCDEVTCSTINLYCSLHNTALFHYRKLRYRYYRFYDWTKALSNEVFLLA